jgi:hypothetical protein
LHDVQQDLYEDFLAAETLLGTDRALYIMKENGVGSVEADYIAQGLFKEEDPLTANKLMTDFEKLIFDDLPFSEYQNELVKAQIRMQHTPLMPLKPEELEAAFEEGRPQFAKGGEVIVPNAPIEPDERIDKMTGQPYNIQAGSAFVDEEDPEKRMLFNEGGIVDKVTKALGVSKQDLDWAKSLDKKFPESEQLDGRGDAARHLALGWLAKKSNYPKASQFAINAREFVEFDFKGGPMDIENNNKGFNLDASSREEAERKIMRMINNKEVLYYTPQESKARRGY